ncbi:hypothetical protein LCGC14_1144150 [marine sediment metagenome]|uniref:Uncharacterized protein n=1 Tax=marine sediment metagenome TaxID=412755 RepID=A0A0F9M285_9ZZZZ
MVTGVAGKEIESAVRNAVREEGFLCPECNKRGIEFVLNSKYGFVCKLCDVVIRLSE